MQPQRKPTLARQFTIKRLLWTLIIASALMKIADMTSIFQYIFANWESATLIQQIAMAISVVVIALVGIGYTVWLGLRLPWILESYFEVRRKRKIRREELAKLVAAKRSSD